MKAVFMMVPRNVSLWAGWPPHVTGSNLKRWKRASQGVDFHGKRVFARDDFGQHHTIEERLALLDPEWRKEWRA